MDKISPPVQQNYLVRPNQDFKKNSTLNDVVSEIGIFGTILWCVHYNEYNFCRILIIAFFYICLKQLFQRWL